MHTVDPHKASAGIAVPVNCTSGLAVLSLFDIDMQSWVDIQR